LILRGSGTLTGQGTFSSVECDVHGAGMVKKPLSKYAPSGISQKRPSQAEMRRSGPRKAFALLFRSMRRRICTMISGSNSTAFLNPGPSPRAGPSARSRGRRLAAGEREPGSLERVGHRGFVIARTLQRRLAGTAGNFRFPPAYLADTQLGSSATRPPI
jgi:hypothetical protein